MQSNSFSQTIQVTEDQTAIQYGSGLLPVFATPAVIALMENTAMQLIPLPDGFSSVGISINMQHVKASPVGAYVQCTATVTSVEGRKYTFEIIASDSNSDVIAKAVHERVVVDITKFLSKIV
ncbi:MAG: thioesterase family protein [Bacteroidota bacterium]|nr:thioesterase family protein [Bacteroidota bacterium]